MKKLVTTLVFGAMALAAPLYSVARTLDIGEETHLIFMREEEKLARDVYMTLGDFYPDDATFTNIGDDSEQTHRYGAGHACHIRHR